MKENTREAEFRELYDRQIQRVYKLALLLLGDFPRRDGNTLLYVYRAGKYEWLLGQMLMSILSIVTYLGAVLTFCILSGIRDYEAPVQ